MSAHRCWRAAERQTAGDGRGSGSCRADRAGRRCPSCHATIANARDGPMAQAAARLAAVPVVWLLPVLQPVGISAPSPDLSGPASLPWVARPALLRHVASFAAGWSALHRLPPIPPPPLPPRVS